MLILFSIIFSLQFYPKLTGPTVKTEPIWFVSPRFILHLRKKLQCCIWFVHPSNMYSLRCVSMPWTSPFTTVNHAMTKKKKNFHSQNASLQRGPFAVWVAFPETDSICFNALLPFFQMENLAMCCLLRIAKKNTGGHDCSWIARWIASVRQPIDFVSVLINVLFPGKRV